MDIQLYRSFFNIQNHHWWFVTKKKIVLDLISRYVPLTSQSKILDVGCGSGLMLGSLSSIGITSGFDTSNEAISFSKEIFNGDLSKGSLPHDFPYKDNYFDLITALDVIEHIDDDAGAVNSMYSKLKIGGTLIITVPAFMFLWSSFDDLNYHKRRYTVSTLKEVLLNSEFKIEKISYYNFLLFPLILCVRKLNNLLGIDGMSDIAMPSRFVNYALKSIFGVELFLLRMFSKLPFGVSILAVVKK